MARATLKLDGKALAGLVKAGGDVDRNVAKAAGWTRDEAKRIIRNERRTNSGKLQNSLWSKYHRNTSTNVVYRVGSDLSYAIYQHEGVKGPVRPKRAKFLRFKPKGSNTFVFARETKGFKGIKFLTRARDRLKPSHFRVK